VIRLSANHRFKIQKYATNGLETGIRSKIKRLLNVTKKSKVEISTKRFFKHGV